MTSTKRPWTGDDLLFFFIVALMIGFMIGVSVGKAHCEPLTISATAPLWGHDPSSTCSNRVLVRFANTDSMWIVFITSSSSMYRRDSLWRRPGAQGGITLNVVPGTYSITATSARKRPNGTLRYALCDTTIDRVVEPLPAATPIDLK